MVLDKCHGLCYDVLQLARGELKRKGVQVSLPITVHGQEIGCGGYAVGGVYLDNGRRREKRLKYCGSLAEARDFAEAVPGEWLSPSGRAFVFVAVELHPMTYI